MPELNFQIEGVAATPFAAVPMLGFQVRVTNSKPEPVHTVALRCQIQIESTRRQYTLEDQLRLRDLYGEPHRWAQTLRSMLWTHAGVVVPPFSDSTVFELPVPCTFDFNVAAVKYFQGLQNGDIPLCFQFSGTVFYDAGNGSLQVAPISWDKEAKFRLPVQIWSEMMDLYYPNSAWLSLRRDVFERLYARKVQQGTPSWEELFEDLLQGAREEVRS